MASPEDRTLPFVDARALALRAGARVWNWDALRFVATFDIVALHTTAQHGVFGVGLPLYLLMTCALGARGGRSAGAELHVRLRRLLPPFIYGWLLYACVRTLEASREGRAPWGWFEPVQLLTGPRVHLWFLPYACVLGAVTAGLAPLALRAPSWLTRTLLPAACIACGWLAARAPAAWPLSQWTFSLPALPLGLAFYLRVAKGERAPLLASALGLCGLLWVDPAATLVLPRFLTASGLLWLAAELPQAYFRWLSRLTPALLGVYVLHPFVFTEWVHDGLWKLGLGRLAFARAGITFVISLLASVILRTAWGRLHSWRRARLELTTRAEVI